MAFEFKLPDVGEGIAEGEIVSWLVKQGDGVKEDQPLLEIMTDKATVEITSPRSGTILKLIGDEGDVVLVGAPLVVFGEQGEGVPGPSNDPAPPQEAAPSTNGQPQTPPAVAENGGQPATATAATTLPRGRVLAAPATRRLAREQGVDIVTISGTGPHGRVTPGDVMNAAQGGATTAVAAAPVTPSASPSPSVAPTALVAGVEEERVPLRGVRKVISHHMEQARDHVAAFTYVDEVDVSELVKLRADLKPLAQDRGVKLSYLPFIVKAVVAGLKKHPYLNASLDEASQEIVLKRAYHIGIAAATEQGLIVPVVKSADRRSILEIAQEVVRLAEAARAGKSAPEDLQGSTFTITSLGSLGGLFATPIVNYPELAIMGIHEIKKRPVVVDNQIVIRDVMLISLTFDHRIIDGHVGAAFANEVKRLLENPKLLLVEA